MTWAVIFRFDLRSTLVEFTLKIEVVVWDGSLSPIQASVVVKSGVVAWKLRMSVKVTSQFQNENPWPRSDRLRANLIDGK